MTTSRKPPQAPKPKHTRPLAQPETPKNPITQEIMQRVRRVIAQSKGSVTIKSVAEEADVSPTQLREWLGSWRSSPYGDNLLKLMRWLAVHDDKFVREIIQATKIKFRGPVEDITRKLTDAEIEEIRTSEEPGTVLAARHRVHPTMIGKIRNGHRYTE